MLKTNNVQLHSFNKIFRNGFLATHATIINQLSYNIINFVSYNEYMTIFIFDSQFPTLLINNLALMAKQLVLQLNKILQMLYKK